MYSIKSQTFLGFIWAASGSVGNGLISLLVTFILARILCPADFGVLEIILVVTGISTVLIDSGFSQALIRDKKASNIDRSTVFFVNIGIAIFLYTILFFLAPFFEILFDIPNFTKYGRIAFLTIVLDSFSIIQNTIFTAELNFKPISIATIIASIIASIIAIILAKLHFGVWALVIMLLLTSLLKTSILWSLSSWRPTIIFDKYSFSKYWKFGSFVFLQSLVDKIMINIESLVIGCFYTKSQLGFFSQSRKIDSYFGQALTGIVVKVTYPALININTSDSALKNGYRRILGLTTFFISPFMLYMIFFPNTTMGALYGDKWIEAGQYLRLWAIFGLVHPIQSICINIFYVKGKSKLLFWISCIKQMLKISIICLLATKGIYSMLLGIIAVSVLMMLVFVYYSGKLINYSLIETFYDVSKNILTALVACILSLFLFKLSIFGNLGLMVSCGTSFLIVMLLYYGMSAILKNCNLRELFNLINNFIAARRNFTIK